MHIYIGENNNMGGGKRYVGLFLFCCLIDFTFGNFVFNVEHKFGGKENEKRTLSALRAHDQRRHGRSLSAVDLPLGGDGSPTGASLYFTRLGLGTPSKDYYLQVDTGSDIMWVNCAGCDSCPKKSGLNIPLSLYNPKDSKTSRMLTCEQDFCGQTVKLTTCKVGAMCPYRITYGDGSTSDGNFVTDTIQLNKASADRKTMSMNSSVIFGCGSKQAGELGTSDQAVDGILGFGRANSSLISQLAAAEKVKKIFSHCLNSKGGGTFAIGELAQPKVKSTPYAPDMPHYNVKMIGIEMDQKALELPSSGQKSGIQMVFDSGTTLAYLEDDLHKLIVKKIIAAQPDLELHIVQKVFSCFNFSENVTNSFPTITFRFENSLSLTVYPHEYLFQARKGEWCIGWQNSGVQTDNGKAFNLLGDMVIANKLVVYDLESKTLGWTDYNCSAGVKLKDGQDQYIIGDHNLSFSTSFALPLHWGFSSFLSLFIILAYNELH